MKKYINILLVAAVSLNFFACSEDVMDEINTDKNNPTKMSSKFILTDVMTSTAFSVVGSDLAFYAGCYIEHNVGSFNQLYRAEMRLAEPIVSSTYNNSWYSIYNNLRNLKVCIEKCSKGGEEEGNYPNLAVAQILTAYNLAVLTDLFGNVPWSEALQPGIVNKPKVDKQEDIYNDIFTLLDNAIANLAQETSYSIDSKQDLLYGGDDEAWLKFAYGLKARYTLRLSKQKPDYKSVIDFAQKSFTKADEECKFVYNGKTSISPFYQFSNDRDYLSYSASFNNLLKGKSDPRESILVTPHPDGSGATDIAPNGNVIQQQGVYQVSALSQINTLPTYLLSYHEVQFILAEAYARQNDATNAKAALDNAVAAAMSKEGVECDAADITSYCATLNATIKEIAQQKYIAFFEQEAVEAYNDIRRWKAMGETNIDLKHPHPENFPLRFTYGTSDVSANPNVTEVYEATDVYKDNVWWAGGNK